MSNSEFLFFLNLDLRNFNKKINITILIIELYSYLLRGYVLWLVLRDLTNFLQVINCLVTMSILETSVNMSKLQPTRE